MTLGELLVSTALLGLTAGATATMLEQGQQVWAVGATAVEAQQSARAALTWLVTELRGAGQGNSGEALPALSVAEPARLVLHLDRNRDGVIAGAAESVTWLLAGDVLRREAGGGAQPVINAVRALSLHLRRRRQPSDDRSRHRAPRRHHARDTARPHPHRRHAGSGRHPHH